MANKIVGAAIKEGKTLEMTDEMRNEIIDKKVPLTDGEKGLFSNPANKGKFLWHVAEITKKLKENPEEKTEDSLAAEADPDPKKRKLDEGPWVSSVMEGRDEPNNKRRTPHR